MVVGLSILIITNQEVMLVINQGLMVLEMVILGSLGLVIHPTDLNQFQNVKFTPERGILQLLVYIEMRVLIINILRNVKYVENVVTLLLIVAIEAIRRIRATNLLIPCLLIMHIRVFLLLLHLI